MKKYYKFILAGDTGTGKTAQFLTMPGRKYVDAFDPAIFSTLPPDIPHTTYFPTPTDLDIMPRSGVKGGKRKSDSTRVSDKGPQIYLKWANNFTKRVESGFFNNIDSYMLDSATLLGRACLERHRYLGDLQGREDERIDHRQAGDVIVDAIWAIMSLPCHVIVTLHTKYGEDKETFVKEHRLTIPGGAKLYLPRFASAVWFTDLEEGKNGASFKILTRPQKQWPHVRTPLDFGNLELWHDVTIKDFSCPEKYGIGALIARAEEQDKGKLPKAD